MNSGVYQYADDMEEADLTREGFNRFMVDDIDLKFYKEGMTTSVMVVREKSTGVYLLAVNGKIDASSEGDLPTQLLSGHIPLLMNRRSCRKRFSTEQGGCLRKDPRIANGAASHGYAIDPRFDHHSKAILCSEQIAAAKNRVIRKLAF